uniref:cathepsin O isoform X2 n=1 Tax=Myxine glutinosa TaxID=7769 RepID=UPI00358E96FC
MRDEGRSTPPRVMPPSCLLLGLSLASCIIGTSESLVAGDFVRFIGFMKTFNKTYREKHEYEQRFSTFQESLRRYERLNFLSGNASGVARYGVTIFSDLSAPEFEGYLGLGRASVAPRQPLASEIRDGTLDSLPARFDWREKGAITAVKDQKSCGGCWAFSCVELLESAAVRSGRPLKALSEQQVLDCSRNNYGCSGGHVLLALKWLNQTRVQVVEDSRYPFVGAAGPCRNFSSSTSGVCVQNYYWRSYRNCEKRMQAILLKEGPLAITVDALSWQDYLGGIIQHHCSQTYPNHAVVVIGYDTTGIANEVVSVFV